MQSARGGDEEAKFGASIYSHAAFGASSLEVQELNAESSCSAAQVDNLVGAEQEKPECKSQGEGRGIDTSVVQKFKSASPGENAVEVGGDSFSCSSGSSVIEEEEGLDDDDAGRSDGDSEEEMDQHCLNRRLRQENENLKTRLARLQEALRGARAREAAAAALPPGGARAAAAAREAADRERAAAAAAAAAADRDRAFRERHAEVCAQQAELQAQLRELAAAGAARRAHHERALARLRAQLEEAQAGGGGGGAGGAAAAAAYLRAARLLGDVRRLGEVAAAEAEAARRERALPPVAEGKEGGGGGGSAPPPPPPRSKEEEEEREAREEELLSLREEAYELAQRGEAAEEALAAGDRRAAALEARVAVLRAAALRRFAAPGLGLFVFQKRPWLRAAWQVWRLLTLFSKQGGRKSHKRAHLRMLAEQEQQMQQKQEDGVEKESATLESGTTPAVSGHERGDSIEVVDSKSPLPAVGKEDILETKCLGLTSHDQKVATNLLNWLQELLDFDWSQDRTVFFNNIIKENSKEFSAWHSSLEVLLAAADSSETELEKMKQELSQMQKEIDDQQGEKERWKLSKSKYAHGMAAQLDEEIRLREDLATKLQQRDNEIKDSEVKYHQQVAELQSELRALREQLGAERARRAAEAEEWGQQRELLRAMLLDGAAGGEGEGGGGGGGGGGGSGGGGATGGLAERPGAPIVGERGGGGGGGAEEALPEPEPPAKEEEGGPTAPDAPPPGCAQSPYSVFDFGLPTSKDQDGGMEELFNFERTPEYKQQPPQPAARARWSLGALFGAAAAASAGGGGGASAAAAAPPSPPPSAGRPGRTESAASLASSWQDFGGPETAAGRPDGGGGGWVAVTAAEPAPDCGPGSPVIDALLRSWSDNSAKTDYVRLWLLCLHEGRPRPAGMPPNLQLRGVSREVKDGFLMLVVPLLQTRREVSSWIKEVGPDLWDVRIKVKEGPASEINSSLPNDLITPPNLGLKAAPKPSYLYDDLQNSTIPDPPKHQSNGDMSSTSAAKRIRAQEGPNKDHGYYDSSSDEEDLFPRKNKNGNIKEGMNQQQQRTKTGGTVAFLKSKVFGGWKSSGHEDGNSTMTPTLEDQTIIAYEAQESSDRKSDETSCNETTQNLLLADHDQQNLDNGGRYIMEDSTFPLPPLQARATTESPPPSTTNNDGDCNVRDSGDDAGCLGPNSIPTEGAVSRTPVIAEEAKNTTIIEHSANRSTEHRANLLEQKLAKLRSMDNL